MHHRGWDQREDFLSQKYAQSGIRCVHQPRLQGRGGNVTVAIRKSDCYLGHSSTNAHCETFFLRVVSKDCCYCISLTATLLPIFGPTVMVSLQSGNYEFL